MGSLEKNMGGYENDIPGPGFLRRDAAEKPYFRPRVIVMLGSRMQNPKGLPFWHFPLVSASKASWNKKTNLPGEVSAGGAKIRATVSVFEQAKESGSADTIRIFTTGGNEMSNDSRATEARRLLVEKYNLPADSVIALVSEVGSTIGNALSFCTYVRSHPGEFHDMTDFELIGNEYQMLRSWILFSAAMLKLTRDKLFRISTEDKQVVQDFFARAPEPIEPDFMEKTALIREQVMDLLRERYFKESKIQVIPLLAEEVLDADRYQYKNRGAVEYADRIRNNPRVRADMKDQYQGIMDFLNEAPLSGAREIAALQPLQI